MKTHTKKKLKNFFDDIEKILPKETLEEIKLEAQKKIFKLKLNELRKQFGIKQTDLKGFSQVSISRIESRNDIRISTLIDYIHACGLGLEIKAIPRKKKSEEFILLKSTPSVA